MGLSIPTISVIVLTYNREQYLARAIDSILAQDFTDFELIIVDNGSSDKSGAIADTYAVHNKRVQVIHRERGTIGAGRNTGLDAARGTWITFVDDDDYVDTDLLGFLYSLAVETDADIAICGSYDKPYDEMRVYNAEDALVELFWRRRFNVQFPTKLINYKLFNGDHAQFRFDENAKYDDIELMPRVLAAARCVAYHGLPKYRFCRHTGNNSAWTGDHHLLDRATLDEYLRVYRERTDWLCERFPAHAATWHYFEWSFMISMIEKIDRLNLIDCFTQADELRRELEKVRDDFFENESTLDFEKDWITAYVSPIKLKGMSKNAAT